MQLERYNQRSNPTTPLLSYRSAITLEVDHELRSDYSVMAANEVAGLEVEDFKQGEFDRVIFESDRVSLEQIQNFIFRYDALDDDSQPLSNNVIFITSTAITKGKVTGFNARVRGMRIESDIAIELPNLSSYSAVNVQKAFSFIGSASQFGTQDNVQISEPDVLSENENYVIEPSFGKKFRYSDSSVGLPYHVQAASDLDLDQRNIVYVGRASTSSDINPFND